MKKVLVLLMMTFIGINLTSCMKPYQEKIYVDVKSSETAFVLPLEGENKAKQGKLDSESYLEGNKVAVKRIQIPTRWHKTGRWFLGHNGKWIPTVKVIIVDRKPETKKWTGKQNDINVESKESISFGIGVTVTASIPEYSTAKFLYQYSGKSLETVVETDIRPYIQSVLTSEFGNLKLEECQASRAIINKNMVEKVGNHFKNYGIEIKQLGIVGGFTYESESIQQSIDSKFNSAQKVISSENEVLAANNFLKAANAIRKQKEVANEEIMNLAIAEGIKSGRFLSNLSTLVVDGESTSLIDLFAAKNINK